MNEHSAFRGMLLTNIDSWRERDYICARSNIKYIYDRKLSLSSRIRDALANL
jgi:hypothetical protein